MTAQALEITVAPLSAIPIGEGRTFEIAGERIAIFNARTGQVFAVQASCPHKGGPLADGLLGEATIVCPLHASKFDLTTGASLGGPAGSCSLKVYPARLNDQQHIVLTLPIPAYNAASAPPARE